MENLSGRPSDVPGQNLHNLRGYAASPSLAVGCLEDKPKEWDHPGRFKCKSCGATSDKKNKLCKPTKIEKKKK